MNKQSLILLDGMTGAGKTTATRILSEKMPRTAIIGMDRVKRFVSDFERGERDNKIAREIVLTLASKYLDLGLSVIVDQPFTAEEVEVYQSLADKHALPIFKFQLFAKPEVAYARVIDRQKDKADKVPEERIQRNISLFNDRADLGFTVIDTSDLNENGASEIMLNALSE